MKKYIFFAISIALVVTGYLFIKHQVFLYERHHLLCEVLKPGMSEDEVTIKLKRAGDFTMSKGEWGGGDIVLGIHFTDSQVRDRYGYFSVVFFDYEYVRAVVSHASDNPEIICDFYQLTYSVTETPKPLP